MSEQITVKGTGACACGAVRFEFDGPARPVIACHCNTCRRTSGHYWASTQVYERDLKMIADAGLKWFRSSDFARRGFCGECGSSLFFQPDDSGRVSIAGGALDAPTGLRLTEHIGTAEAGDYYQIESGPDQSAGMEISERWRLPPVTG
ncbi:MAG: GFA family protein [Gammaproteobacteria bacterium]|nr:GFA family protein [Gammaproteobacteria bacterium]